MKREPHAHIWVKTPVQLSKIKIDTILCCKSKCGITTVFQLEKSEIETLESITSLEKMLPADSFYRCHRACLVNLDHVEHFMEKTSEAVLIGDTRVPVARNQKKMFLAKLVGA